MAIENLNQQSIISTIAIDSLNNQSIISITAIDIFNHQSINSTVAIDFSITSRDLIPLLTDMASHTIPVDIVRVKSYANRVFDPACVPMRVNDQKTLLRSKAGCVRYC